MDGSENVDAETFNQIKKFVSGVLDAYNLAKNKSRVAIVTYGNTMFTNHDLNDAASKSALHQAIANAERVDGVRDLSRTAEFVKRQLFDKHQRPESGKILILIVAGSKDQIIKSNELRMVLKSMEKQGISVVIVAVGDVAKSVGLRNLVKDENLVKIPVNDRLKEAVTPIVDASGKAAGKI